MRRFISGCIILTLVILFSGRWSLNYGFHSGGTGNCGGCHTMHNSLHDMNGAVNSQAEGQSNAYLLKESDPSSTCLNCHQGSGDSRPTAYHVSTPSSEMPTGTSPKQFTPGGDFGWLKKSYTWSTSGGVSKSSSADRHGHNIIAENFGYVADSELTQAPGGTYPADKFSCISCHDPHGKYRILADGSQETTGKPIKGSGSYGAEPTPDAAVGVFRLLAGKGYQPKSLTGNYAFQYEAPLAVSPINYNRSEESSDTRVAYGKNSSEWCSNCHSAMNSLLGSGMVHPTGVPMNPKIVSTYNQYVKSGDLTGTAATAYTSLVPFQLGGPTTTIGQLLAATTSKTGPTSDDRVTCLTCHRAHASGWDHAARWNLKATFLTVAGDYPGTDRSDEGALGEFSNGRTKAEVKASYYNRSASVFASYQRSLCNKCHAKD